MPKLEMDQLITPIWDAASGERLALARMSLLLDQKQLAALLGVSQSIICRIEQGKLRVPERPFSLHALKSVFPKLTSFILLGTNPENMSRAFIVSRYWKKKLENNGKIGNKSLVSELQAKVYDAV